MDLLDTKVFWHLWGQSIDAKRTDKGAGIGECVREK